MLKTAVLRVGMVCRGYEYSTLFVRSIIPRGGAVHAILYICREIRKSVAVAALKCCVAAWLGVSRDISGFELSRGVTVGWFDRRTEWCGNCMITVR